MKTFYINGMVYVGENDIREAFVVEDEKFTLVGSAEEVLAQKGPEDSLVDLGGKFVCPGFNDSHMHLVEYGDSLGAARLDLHTDSLEGMIAYFKDFLAENPVKEGGWLYGRGWNQDYFTDADRMPTRWDLDRVSRDIPVVAVRACGHAVVINSALIERMGLTPDQPDPPGGSKGRQNGQLDGRLFDNAIDPVLSQIPAPTAEDVKDMIRLACKSLNSYGVTSSQTDDYGFARSIAPEAYNEAYRSLAESGELTVRVTEQCNFTNPADLRTFVEAGNVTGAGDTHFRIGPLKMLGDGALGARTAFLSEPYADDPGNTGLPVFTQEVMDEMVDYANAHGMSVAIHAIGDACLDRVLHAVKGALENCPRKDHRHGVVHCQITRADQLKTMADLGMHIYAQSIFLDYDSHIVRARVGNALAETSYNWKTLMRQGLSVSNGTDCPVELPDALKGIQCAVTRKSIHGGEAYLPQQAFTVSEALDSYTIRGAEASFEEQCKGRIAPGMLADFVILGENPLEISPEAIHSIPVLATYLGGKAVYTKS